MRDIVLFLDVPNSGSTAMYYQAARSLELTPVLVTADPSGGGRAIDADRVRVSRMDLATVLSAVDRVGRERIAGVFACSSSWAELAARMAAALDRPHADPHAISLCNDKHRLREFLTRKGLNTVDYHHVTTLSDAARAVESLGGALVLKPLSSTGSNGVRICRTADEALSHAGRLLKWKRNGLLVEKYIDAPQYSVECFDGTALNVKELHFSDGPFPIIIGVDAPAALTQDRLEELKAYAGSIVSEVGLSNGPSFMELRYSGAEKYLIEINPRPSVSSPIQILAVTGINLADLCLKFACGIHYGRSSLAEKRNNRAYAGRFVVRSGSTVRAIEGLEEARQIAGVGSIHVSESLFYRRGPATCALDRIAAVHSEADNIEAAAASARSAINKLIVIYDKFPMNLFRYYSQKINLLYTRLLNKYILQKA